MELILPEGIFANSPGIAGAIERMNSEPLDLADIIKLWKGKPVMSHISRSCNCLIFGQSTLLPGEDFSILQLNV
jgi:hypothetical protein